MKKIIVAGLLMVSPMFISTANADDVETAHEVCEVLDNTGLLSAPCEVSDRDSSSGLDSSIDVSLDVNGSEARDICKGAEGMLRERNFTFSEKTWSLKIYSPYSDGNTLAECSLPQS